MCLASADKYSLVSETKHAISLTTTLWQSTSSYINLGLVKHILTLCRDTQPTQTNSFVCALMTMLSKQTSELVHLSPMDVVSGFVLAGFLNASAKWNTSAPYPLQDSTAWNINTISHVSGLPVHHTFSQRHFFLWDWYDSNEYTTT